MDRILLFSGGIDSVVGWHLLGQPTCLYVGLGRTLADSPDYVTACRAALHLRATLKRVAAPWTAGPQDDGHIALRNLHLISVGALYADEVILGAVKGESSPDKSDTFLRSISRACTKASQGRQIRATAPLKLYTKRQLVQRFLTQVGQKRGREIIATTHSCYSTTEARCGRCMACFRRWVALSLNEIHEEHAHPPWEMDLPRWTDRLTYMRNAPRSEWLGIAESNLEAAYAIRSARQLFERR